MIVRGPTAPGTNATLQLAALPAPLSSQVANVAPPSTLKLTLPLGTLAVPTSMSLTVAAHVVGAFTGSVAGSQYTLVLVRRGTFVADATLTMGVDPRWAIASETTLAARTTTTRRAVPGARVPMR